LIGEAGRNEEAAMSSTDADSEASVSTTDLKLEVVVIPVSDVDRAKAFYGSLGWRLDADFPFDNGFRIVQFTPPGSGCSIQFGTNITSAAPGSAQGLTLIVSDIDAARSEIAARGVEISGVFHAESPGAQFRPDGASGRVDGPDPEDGSYRSFATFTDPDGNGWLLQEITTRLAGRVAGEATYSSVVGRRPGPGAPASGRRARRARATSAWGRVRRELAGLVRPVHGRRGDGSRIARVSAVAVGNGAQIVGEGIETA
jgi:catechol 2,3-dioxygenase-like lactoylglutathione lyase family enzyme